MPSPSNSYTRRRWLSTFGLLTAGAGISAKIMHSGRIPTREEMRLLAVKANEMLDGQLPDVDSVEEAVEEFLASEPLTKPKRPRPTPQSRPEEPPRPPSEYAKFIAKFDFRYIQPHEVIQPHRRVRNGVANSLPPSRLWANMPDTLRVADEIRHRLGTPLDYITSAYRSPSYNRQCGGASRSLHMRNNALDLVYASGPDAAFAIAKELRKEGFFRGGIGLYRGFIHVDTRGQNASWTG